MTRPDLVLRRLLAVALVAVVSSVPGAPARAEQPAPAAVESLVEDELAAGGTTDFWVYLREEAELAAASAITDRAAQGRFVHQRLTETARSSQAGLRRLLDAEGVAYQPFWIANAVRVTGDAALLERIAARPEIAQVTADRVYALPEALPAKPQAEVGGVEWNVDRVGAPRVWETYGATGEGIVVGTIDSGVEFDHPALVDQYRGNLGGGEFDHNYHWHDPSQVCGSPSLVPCDNEGHGTHVTGTIVGDDGGENRIGVAPGARWIAAKGCEDRNCSQAALLSAGQFMLAPTDLHGENPDPARRPHIVNNSWGGGAGDDPWYQPTVRAWLEAGIFPQFSNGNTTSGVAPCGSSGNPGNLPESYAAGAFGIDNVLGDYSNRGPSAFDSDLVKPNIAAPGTDVRSSVPGGGYELYSGTSMASPHVAGAVALLWSAAGSLVREVDATREVLDQTAIDVEDLTCGGEPANNNLWGQGRLDVRAAVEAAPRGPAGMLSGVVRDAGTGDPVAGATVTVEAADRAYTTGEDGRYAVSLPVGEYEVVASAFGYHPRPAGVTITEDATISQDFSLAPMDRVAVSGVVTDGSGHGWPLYARVEVPGTPVSTFTDPVTGRYRLTLPAGESYQLRAVPQYPGYASVTESIEVGDRDLTRDLTAAVDSCAQAPGYQLRNECRPVPGGLVLGQVTDANTGDPVSGATVTSVDNPGEAGASAATPDDPALGDGFYWLFSSQTGRVALSATASGYAETAGAATVTADGTGEADFRLAAGRLAVEPSGIAAELRLGEAADRTVTVTNTGSAPAELAMRELPGPFEVRDGGPPAPVPGERWQAPAGLQADPGHDPAAPTTEGQYQAGTRPAATPSAAGEVITSWSPGDLSLAWGIGYEGDAVWLSDVLGGGNHEFTPDGEATGVSHPTGWAGDWAGGMARLGEAELCQVSVGGDNGIHCWDTGSGEPTRAITGGFPWTTYSQRGLAYRPDDDTFYIGGWNENVLYQVRGFSHETPGEVIGQCDYSGMGISGLAWNPTASLLWVATNTETDDLYLVNPDGCGILDTLGHPSPGFNGAGLALNDDGNLWLTSQGNEGAPNAVYLVESGVPNVSDVPWLAADPPETTLEPGERVTVTVSMDTAATTEEQPGSYSAGLWFDHDTPYPVDPAEVSMEVTPPRGWGAITGTVTGIDCGGEEHVPAGATVTLAGRNQQVELRAGADGSFTHWFSVTNNRVTVRASADGYQPEQRSALVIPRRASDADLALHRTDAFGYGCGPEEAGFAEAETVLAISGPNAAGTVDMPFAFPFYGEGYDQARICGNGYVELMGPGTSFPIGCTFDNARIPTSARPDAAIYPFWDGDLLVDEAASIRADVRGSAPDRRLVIEFRNLGFSDVDDPERRIDFNVVLHENGEVLTQYRNVDDDPRERGSSATFGIEDHTGGMALQYSYDEPVLAAGSGVTSIRYVPPPPPPQEPTAEAWVARYDGAGGDDVARAVEVSPDGSRVFVTGHGPGDGTGSDYATVAYDAASGERLWADRYDGPVGGDDFARAVEVSPDGSRVFVTGYSPGDGTGSDYATVAYDAASGARVWEARYDGPAGGLDQAYAMAVSPDGSLVTVAGRSIGTGTGFDYATVAYDAATGEQRWAAGYDGPSSYAFDQAFAVAVSPDSGQVYVAGQSENDYTTIAYDTVDGSEVWMARHDSGGTDSVSGLAVSPDGGQVFITGQSDGDYATVAYDTVDGGEAWAARYDAGSADAAAGLAVSPDGDQVFVTGQSQYDYATVAYDTVDGSERWVARHDGGGSDAAMAVGVSPDGGQVFVTGHSQGSGADYATVAYGAEDGSAQWDVRYQGPVSGDDTARVLVVSPDGSRVYVSGDSPGAASGLDYATLAYDTAR